LSPATKPRLDWSNPAFADHYHLQAATDALFTVLVIDKPNIVPSEFTPSSNLDPNTKYYWHVKACNSQGKCSAWSAARTFRTALPAPISLSANGSIQDLRPKLKWYMPAYPLPIPTNYTVQISRNNSFTQVVSTWTATGMSYTPSTDLPRNLTLYWHVRANGTNGPSAWSGFSPYTTGNPPSIPVLLSPPSNTLVSSYKPLLDWADSTIPKGAAAFDHYVLQIDDNAGFSSPLVTQSVFGYTYNSSAAPVTALPSNTQFSWHVRACNTNAECSAWSAAFTFRTKLSPPVAIAPVGAATVASLKPTFSWNTVSGAASYALQVSKVTSFSTLLMNVSISKSASTYTPASNLPASTPLYWRIRTNGANGPSNWMAYQSFSTP
jgi:hypothetical protein